jgi:hypothetical protein
LSCSRSSWKWRSAGQRLGLVDQPEAGVEAQHHHRLAAAVAVPRAPSGRREAPRTVRQAEQRPERLPVGEEMGDDLQDEVDPLAQRHGDLPGEDGVGPQQLAAGRGGAGAGHEMPEPLLRRRPREAPLLRGDVELHRERTAEEQVEREDQELEEDLRQGVRIKRRTEDRVLMVLAGRELPGAAAQLRGGPCDERSHGREEVGALPGGFRQGGAIGRTSQCGVEVGEPVRRGRPRGQVLRRLPQEVQERRL